MKLSTSKGRTIIKICFTEKSHLKQNITLGKSEVAVYCNGSMVPRRRKNATT